MKSIAIVGGGIGGLTAALCLLKRGFAVTVYEQAEQLKEIGAGVQISPNAARLLHRLGLQKELDAIAVRPASFQMRRWSDDAVIFEAQLGAVCEQQFGAPYYTFHRADLHQVLANAVPREVIKLGHRLSEVREEGSRQILCFEGGAQASASIVIGADGLKSVVRQSVTADKAVFSQQAVCRGLVPAERVSELVAERRVIIWVGPGKHMVCYPVRSATLLNWGLAMPAGDARLESWTGEGTRAEALQSVQGWNEQVRSIVGATDKTLVLPLYDREPIHNLARGNMTLLGDAAHPMLPFMAQGAGQAIEDGWVLADCLAAQSKSVAEQLHLYETLRSKRTEEVQVRSRMNSDKFHLSDGDAQRSRDQALQAGGMALKAFEWLYGYDAATATDTALAAS